jgi:hypothetical protein
MAQSRATGIDSSDRLARVQVVAELEETAMTVTRLRSRALRFGAATLVLAGAVLGAAPAQAATPAYLSAFLDRQITIGANGAPGKTFQAWLIGVRPVHPVVAFDGTGLAGVATATFPAACTTTGPVTTCPLPVVGDEVNTLLPITLRPAAGARAGATGTLTYTTSADNVPALTDTSTVRLADGVDLVVPQSSTVDTSRKPGDRVRFPIAFTNRGNRPARGFTLTLVFKHGVRPATYRNCRYAESATYHLATCTFPDTVKPGARWSVQFRATLGRDALGDQFAEYTAAATGTGVPAAMPTTAGGGGPALTAHEVAPAGTLAAVPGDLDDRDNTGRALWQVPNTYDIAAIGDTVRGPAGAVVTFSVGVRNRGPAALDATELEEPAWRFAVGVPAGTRAVRVPAACAGVRTLPDGSVEVHPGAPGYPLYWCETGSFLGAGARSTVRIGLQITTVVPDATSEVTFLDMPPDTDPGNDRARVVVNPR